MDKAVSNRFPREGPASSRESLSSAQALDCPAEYGVGKETLRHKGSNERTMTDEERKEAEKVKIFGRRASLARTPPRPDPTKAEKSDGTMALDSMEKEVSPPDGTNDDNQSVFKEPGDPLRKRGRARHSPTRSKSVEHDAGEAPKTEDSSSTVVTEEFSPIRGREKIRRTNSWTSSKPAEDTRDEDVSMQLATTIRETIRSIDKEVAGIAAIAAAERNTKREIKEAAVKLTKLIKKITSQEAQNLLRIIGKTAKQDATQDSINGGCGNLGVRR